jgi:hypothetical protein
VCVKSTTKNQTILMMALLQNISDEKLLVSHSQPKKTLVSSLESRV